MTWDDLDDRNITRRFYAFAYVNDFRDVEIDGLKIDSKSHMGIIQKKAYEQSNKSIINFEDSEISL